eukprot:5940871-Pyramimonas_sp.AAC.1
MEKGPVTPGLARVIWDVHSFNGSHTGGMSLAYTIVNGYGKCPPRFYLRGARLGLLPKLPLSLAATRLSRVLREHLTGN